MKSTELRKKSLSELKKELLSLLKEQFNLKMQYSSGKSKKSHLLKNSRINIARINTIISEKRNDL